VAHRIRKIVTFNSLRRSTRKRIEDNLLSEIERGLNDCLLFNFLKWQSFSLALVLGSLGEPKSTT
jgi:hypothetical protein